MLLSLPGSRVMPRQRRIELHIAMGLHSVGVFGSSCLINVISTGHLKWVASACDNVSLSSSKADGPDCQEPGVKCAGKALARPRTCINALKTLKTCILSITHGPFQSAVLKKPSLLYVRWHELSHQPHCIDCIPYWLDFPFAIWLESCC